jgi:selenide,water dikinase
VPGAAAHALAVKPVDAFLKGWSDIAARAARDNSALRLAVVGGGAGGVELALAMSHRIRASGGRIACTLVCRGGLLAGHPRRAARLAARQLAREGIGLLAGAEVVEVDAGRLRLADGSAIAFDALVWATGAGAQAWLAQSSLACRDGFVEVDAHLQSTSHAGVFAAGDAASHAGRQWPKSGVTAVRQGPVLAENLLRSIRGQALVAYHAQRPHLALISTGRRHAIASWRGLAWEGSWVWRWKDRIDRRFMERFFVSQSSDHLQRKY